MAAICDAVSRGCFCNINATIPATTGAAMLVPLIEVRTGSVTRSITVPPRELVETMFVPGAATSGLPLPSRVGPRLLLSAIVPRR